MCHSKVVPSCALELSILDLTFEQEDTGASTKAWAQAQWPGHSGTGTMAQAQCLRHRHIGTGTVAQARWRRHDGLVTGTLLTMAQEQE
jgi:hypothetical protein